MFLQYWNITLDYNYKFMRMHKLIFFFKFLYTYGGIPIIILDMVFFMDFKKLFNDVEKVTVSTLLVSLIFMILSLFGIDFYGISLAWISIIFCGIPIFKDAVSGLIKEFDIKADVLVTIAIISSIIIGEIFAAGVVALIMAIGGFLEEYTVSKTRTGIEKLVDLSPTKGTLVTNYGGSEEAESEIEADAIDVDDILKVLPGEVVPVDGVIIKGETSIDQSVMTGESIPIDKQIGDEVFSGTINLYGSFYMKAIKKGEDSSLQKLISLVESASPDNAEIVKAADRWATWIVIIAFVSAIATWIVTGEIIRAVTILVVFCPCALVLATPTAIMASLGNLTNVGILVKEGLTVEKLAKVDEMIFDKTGTLTYGKPEVVDVIPYNEKLSAEDLIHLTASLESQSEHPLARAILNFYKENYSRPIVHVSNFEMIIGKGVKANLDNNETMLFAGNLEFMELNNLTVEKEFLASKVNSYLDEGATPIFVASNDEIMGVVVLADVLREDANEVIRQLRKLGVNATLLTGDNQKAAEYIAHEVDIVDYKYNCLPEDKISAVSNFQNFHHQVAVIGDGINDAPALKQANVGISMGGVGSDVSIEASDVCLVSDDIRYVPHLIAISRKTLKTINISIAFALGLNFLAMFLAMFGFLGPIGGALVHNIGSVVVIIYCSMLMRFKM